MAAGVLRSKFAAGFGQLLGVLVLLHSVGVGSAEAIPYFNAGYGFDNSSLGLEVQQLMDPDHNGVEQIPIIGIEEADAGPALIRELVSEQILDVPLSGIERILEWRFTGTELLRQSSEAFPRVLVIFTDLGTFPSGYEDAVIDIDLEYSGQFEIAIYESVDGPYFFAGFVIEPGELEAGASRTFRYTVDQPQGWDGPPDLRVVATPDFTIIPEPGTALLLGVGLLLLSARRRCGHS